MLCLGVTKEDGANASTVDTIVSAHKAARTLRLVKLFNIIEEVVIDRKRNEDRIERIVLYANNLIINDSANKDNTYNNNVLLVAACAPAVVGSID